MLMLHRINFALLVLLSVSTGLVKLLQMPAEVGLFEKIGIVDAGFLAFGVVQLVAGLLLIPGQTRRAGAVALIPTFVVANAALWVAGIYAFAIVSLLFVAMAAWVVAAPTFRRGDEPGIVTAP